jgi:hypothetical protein
MKWLDGFGKSSLIQASAPVSKPAGTTAWSRKSGGSFPTYVLSVRLPALGFDQDLRVVGVPSVPTGFNGIACFSFLNRFTYGNFGDPSQLGLEG